jgi:hypothetical protein
MLSTVEPVADEGPGEGVPPECHLPLIDIALSRAEELELGVCLRIRGAAQPKAIHE